MFGGITALMLLANTPSVHNLAPGMTGALSHAGLTGACTAGTLGEEAANRAPMLCGLLWMWASIATGIQQQGAIERSTFSTIGH